MFNLPFLSRLDGNYRSATALHVSDSAECYFIIKNCGLFNDIYLPSDLIFFRKYFSGKNLSNESSLVSFQEASVFDEIY